MSILLILSAAAAVASASPAIPEQYHGQWTDNPAACGGEDTGGVTIGAASIDFYEARGVVTSVSAGSKGHSAKVDFTGEGRSWQEGIRLRPFAPGKLELTALGKTSTLGRCPDN